MWNKSNFFISEETLIYTIYMNFIWQTNAGPPSLTHTVSWCMCRSGCEAAAHAGNQRQDRSQGRASVPPTAIRRQPATVTPGDGDRTSAFPGKWPRRFPHSTLPSRYGVWESCQVLTERENVKRMFCKWNWLMQRVRQNISETHFSCSNNVGMWSSFHVLIACCKAT